LDPKRIVEDGYDGLAERFGEWVSMNPPEVREWFLREVLRRLPPNADVLELGCGPGTAARALAGGRSYTAVDLSAVQLTIARDRLPGGTFLLGDFTEVELPDAAFDVIASFYAFNHVPRDEQGPMFVRAFAWLRPGGRFMLSLGARNTLDTIQEDWLGVPMFFAGFDPDANERSLRGAGFELELSETRNEREEGYGEVTFHWVIARKPAM
jgi:SAM-dependent methyltransferase